MKAVRHVNSSGLELFGCVVEMVGIGFSFIFDAKIYRTNI